METIFPSVLLLTDSDVFAGTERHMLELGQALRASGCRVLMGCPGNGALAERSAEIGLEIFPIEKRGRLDLPALRQLVAGLRSQRFQLIHTHNGRTAFLAALATRLSGRGRLVTTQHFLEPAHTKLHGVQGWVSRRLHAWIARRATRIVAISQAVSRSITARPGIDTRKVVVVLNGIGDPPPEELAPRESVRAALGCHPGVPLVMAAARLEKEKGLDVLIRAMAHVRAELPAARCLIIGEGAERQELERLVGQQNLTGSVLLPGFRRDVLSLMKAADVCVLSSPAEPFGLVLLEAMALGVPAVASRAGGALELIQDGETGFLANPSSPEDFAAAILRVLQEPVRAGKLGWQARERYLAHFTAQKMASRMKAVYEAALNSPPAD